MNYPEKRSSVLEKEFFFTYSPALQHCFAELKRRTGYILWIMASVFLFASTACSTGRNTSATRAYHELTTRYNIYFNAEEAYHEILKKRAESFQEDYKELLPFYPYIPYTEKLSSSGPFDPVIDKTGEAIRKHSITSKPRRDPSKAHSQEYRQWLRQEEFNPFLKNVWMLRGKSFLQNGDYDEALSVFSGMLRLFSYDKDLVEETEIWMLRTYTEMGRTYEAEKTIYTLKNKKLNTPLEKLFTEHYTYFLIRKKEFEEVIPHLQKTIAQETDHSQKKRLQFLLGQLYAMNGERDKAYRAFEEVKGLRTPSELALNATLWQSAISDDSLVQVFRPSQSSTETLQDTTPLIAGTDSTAVNFQPIKNTPERLSQGRTLAENATLHRQWRFRNGLWQVPMERAAEGENEQVTPFNPTKISSHYLLLTFSDSTDKNKLLFTISDFNFSNFNLSRFNVSPILLAGVGAIQIEPFRSFEEVSQYTDMIYSDSLFCTSVPLEVTPIIISEENLQLIRSDKELNEYKAFYAENIASPRVFQPVIKDARVEMEGKKEQKPEKIVSLETASQPQQVHQIETETTEALKRKLEENAAKAFQQQQETTSRNNRKQLLKEREQQRKEKLKQRERELKERQRKREAELKQHERERAQKIKKQQ